jgi:hypothetical protein
VDDLFLTGAEKLIEWCKQQLASEFEMKDLGLMHYFLGLEVLQRKDKIFSVFASIYCLLTLINH